MTHPPVAFLVGSDLTGTEPFAGRELETVHTPYGSAVVVRGDGWVLVPRHGPSGSVPPHRINHRANVDALRRLGVSGAFAFSSVGGLHPHLVPGTLLVPDDFVNLGPMLTFHDEEARHATPTLDERLRAALARALESAGLPCIGHGVYLQTAGPRLETRAEVRWMAQLADVVGMTFAHEATLCIEAGIPVAALCSVHNLAHGVGEGEAPRADEIDRRKAEDAPRLGRVARALLAAESER